MNFVDLKHVYTLADVAFLDYMYSMGGFGCVYVQYQHWPMLVVFKQGFFG